ncbi:MAG: DUF3131 domain-containing protein [Pseudomonadota bacterium]
MTFKTGLIKARSHIAFVIGLCIAATVALALETGVATSVRAPSGSVIIISDDQTLLAPTGRITGQDRARAIVAWEYFEKNTQAETGLVNSVNNFPSTTIWDQASYLLGLISAERLGIVDETEFDARMSKVLATLAQLPLFDGKLPNKVYDTRSLAMTDYTNAAIEKGIGWSALDVARMSVPLNILVYDYPQHGALASGILTSWDFAAMLQDGQMFGARVNQETGFPERVQEGRLGYEEYGARALALLGVDALSAGKFDDYLRFENVAGQEIAVDSRSFSEFDAHNYVVSEPYILTAVEFGFDRESQELAHRLYRAQEERFRRSGILTAVSEDNIDQEPYFIYNTVFANGQSWNALAEDGSSHPEKRTVSTKAVFGWDAIYGTDYTNDLMDHIADTRSKDGSGWNSGIYELDGRVNAVATANTNGIILETIQYKQNGPLVTSRFSKER